MNTERHTTDEPKSHPEILDANEQRSLRMKGNNNRETHGFYRRKTKLERVSFNDLNFSSAGGEQLRKRHYELLQHCGGEEFVSAVRRRVIERVIFCEYQLDCLDLYLAGLGPRIINRRKRGLIPIVRERDALVNTLIRLYDQIGLDPVKASPPNLFDYIASCEAGK